MDRRNLTLPVTWAVGFVSLLFAACFVYVALRSMLYPYALEWMEGHTIDVVRRAAEGKKLYDQPSMVYVPLIYMPYYYYVAAFFSLLAGGIDFFPARLVSILATLGAAGVAALWLRREGAGWCLSLSASGVFLATYTLSGRWFDMARVDSLFLFLSVWGLYMAVFWRGTAAALTAAAVLAAAFFTKQTALLMALPVLAALWLSQREHAVKVLAMLLSLVAALSLLLNVSSGGWFMFFTYTVPQGHDLAGEMYRKFWSGDVFGKVGLLLALSLAAVAVCYRAAPRRAALYAALLLGCIGSSYLSRLHSYGFINVLMPMHWCLALLSVLALHLAGQAGRHVVWFPLAGACLLLELATLMYNPQRLIPTPEMKQAGDRFLRALSEYTGDVLIPEVQFVQTRVGKPSYALGMAAFDLFRCRKEACRPVAQRLGAEIRLEMERQRFVAVVPGRFVRLAGVEKYYVPAGRIGSQQRFVAGALGALPMQVYLPNPLSGGRKTAP